LKEEKMKRLHGVKEAAEILGISVYTVRSYVRQGKLRPVRIGRRVLLQEAELERFVGVALADARPNAPDGLMEGRHV
jgi:excisionase family DNA binding protein